MLLFTVKIGYFIGEIKQNEGATVLFILLSKFKAWICYS